MDGIQFKLKTSPVSPEVLHYFAVAHKNNSDAYFNTSKRFGNEFLFALKNPVCSVKPI